MDFDTHMIRKAVNSLKKEIISLSQSLILSPRLGFTKWLKLQCQQQIDDPQSNSLLLAEKLVSEKRSG